MFVSFLWGMLHLVYACLISGLCWTILGYVSAMLGSCWTISVYFVVLLAFVGHELGPYWPYSPYHGYRRYSGFFYYRRCLSGVWQKPFQIEDITRFQSSSNDQKSKNKPFNLGMICAISSICFFLSNCHFLLFFQANYIKSIEHGRPDPGDYSAATVPK